MESGGQIASVIHRRNIKATNVKALAAGVEHGIKHQLEAIPCFMDVLLEAIDAERLYDAGESIHVRVYPALSIRQGPVWVFPRLAVSDLLVDCHVGLAAKIAGVGHEGFALRVYD